MRHRVHVEDMVSELVDGVPYFAIHFSLSAKQRCVCVHFVFSAQLERNYEHIHVWCVCNWVRYLDVHV